LLILDVDIAYNGIVDDANLDVDEEYAKTVVIALCVKPANGIHF